MNPEEAEEYAANNNNIGLIPAAIFTAGLDFDQEVTLQTIIEAMDRGERYIRALAEGNEEMRHQYEPLYRLLTGLSLGAVVPIVQKITQGSNPAEAVREVIAGIGGLTFFAGMEYAKSMGLNGVGVSLPERKNNDADKEGNYYPEQKPPPAPEGFSLKQFLDQVATGDDEDD